MTSAIETLPPMDELQARRNQVLNRSSRIQKELEDVEMLISRAEYREKPYLIRGFVLNHHLGEEQDQRYRHLRTGFSYATEEEAIKSYEKIKEKGTMLHPHLPYDDMRIMTMRYFVYSDNPNALEIGRIERLMIPVSKYYPDVYGENESYELDEFYQSIDDYSINNFLQFIFSDKTRMLDSKKLDKEIENLVNHIMDYAFTDINLNLELHADLITLIHKLNQSLGNRERMLEEGILLKYYEASYSPNYLHFARRS